MMQSFSSSSRRARSTGANYEHDLPRPSSSSDLRDSLAAFLWQETKHYPCRDYLSEPSAECRCVQCELPDPLSIVAECASIVADLSVRDEVTEPRARPPPRPVSPEGRGSPVSIADPSTAITASACRRRSFPRTAAAWRRQMFGWARSVVDRFDVPSQVLATAFRILDMFLEREMRAGNYFAKEDFQLFAMVSLHMASKLLLSTKRLSVSILVEMSREFYSASDLEEVEREILHALSWRVNPITPMDYCRLFVTSQNLIRTCQTIADASIPETHFSGVPAACLGLATALYACQKHGIPVNALMDPLRATIRRMDPETGALASSMLLDRLESTFRRLGEII